MGNAAGPKECIKNVVDANAVKAASILKSLERRGMVGYYCATSEEALVKAMELIPDGASVSWGGSLTLEQIGIKPALKQSGYHVIDRDDAESAEERNQLMKQALTCDVFLTSSNAITMDGELVNIDGNGNRVAAICFGPEQVLVIAGMNKVAADLTSAVQRVKTDACVPNAVRYQTGTPCALTGKCADCTGENTICGEVLVTRRSKIPSRIKVILVGESLGF